MGTSTNGMLYWGYELGDEIPWDDVDGDGWEDVYMEAIGDGRPDLEYEGNEEIFSAYWDRKYETTEELSVEVTRHCSCDYPMYAAVISESCVTAYRGYPERLDPDMFKVPKHWKKKLDEFCETMGIDVEGKEPGWYLASMWC